MHSHTRRDFFARLGAGWLGASVMEQAVMRAAQARAQSRHAPAGLFDLEKVAEGVYAAIARPAALTNCNAAIFENAADVLIVDAHSKPSAVAALVAQIRAQVTPKPIRYVVNTHFHWDHTQGMPAYHRIAPHAEILSSGTTRKLIAEFGVARCKESVAAVPKAIEDYQRQLAAATKPEVKARLEAMIAEARAYEAEMRNYSPELPTMTFDRQLILHDKAHELHLAFRGRGHTAGDIVVCCPQKNVIATGDLLHGFLPFIGDGYPREWPATLKAVGEFDFTNVIGGHGGVQRTRERLPQMAAYIEELTGMVARGKEQGRQVAELQREITPASLRSLSGGYGEFVAGQLVAADDSATPPAPAEALANGVKENIASTWKALERSAS
jgi:glyoxylase-like metal-dependent hydrolase (beta-lactamase superfamily II)